MPGQVCLTYHPLYNGRGFSPVRPSWQRYRMALELFHRLDLDAAARTVQPPLADPDDLLAVHPPQYVEYVRQRAAEGHGYLDRRDTPAWPGLFERALAAVGATLAAVRLIGEGQACHVFNPGGGLHHAHRDRTSGFCIFNDVVLAVRWLQRDYGFRRVAIVDIDGHHGDGVQELLYDEPVLTISFHQYDGRFFPRTGSVDEVGWGAGFGLNVNVTLPAYAGDGPFATAFEQVVPRALRAYRPEVLLVNFGVDGHYSDPLVRLRLSTGAYRLVATWMHQLAHELCDGRLIALGSGGYHPQHAARCWAVLLAILAGRLPAGNDAWPADLSLLADSGVPPADPAAAARVQAVLRHLVERVLPLRLA
jgi:acetoin utilization protein AcuC